MGRAMLTPTATPAGSDRSASSQPIWMPQAASRKIIIPIIASEEITLATRTNSTFRLCCHIALSLLVEQTLRLEYSIFQCNRWTTRRDHIRRHSSHQVVTV